MVSIIMYADYLVTFMKRSWFGLRFDVIFGVIVKKPYLKVNFIFRCDEVLNKLLIN